MRYPGLLAVLGALVLAGCQAAADELAPAPGAVGRVASEPAPGEPDAPADTGVVAFVPDGDTIRLEDGRAVRLVQIDAPEVNPEERAECGGGASRDALRGLAPVGSTVVLERDEALDDVDRFDRLLRYVMNEDGVLLNLELVASGAAAPYFFRGEQGRHADDLVEAARSARAAGLGLWGACPAAGLDPGRGVDTGPP